MDIPADKFRVVGGEKIITDKKFDTKPIGYFKDAFIRFQKNKSSLVAAIIIILLVIYAVVAPIIGETPYTKVEEDKNIRLQYTQLRPKSDLFSWAGVDGGYNTDVNKRTYDFYKAVSSEIGMNLIMKDFGLNEEGLYNIRLDSYLQNSFVYRTLTLTEYQKIQAWQNENNLQVIYPAVDINRIANPNDRSDARIWFETDQKGGPVLENGEPKAIYLTTSRVSDMYDSIRIKGDDGTYQYATVTEATAPDGTVSSSYQVRLFKYNYFIYRFGEAPEFLFGTDAFGYDMFTRLAQGARFSLVFAVIIAAINLFIGAVIGSLEGYYGGVFDLVMERIIEILSGIPFMVATSLLVLYTDNDLFALLYAFILTGWIGISGTVRMQFYRFKGQEYILSARTLGAGDGRLMFKHIFPNSLGTIITGCVLVIPGVIFSESSLTYLGIINLDSDTMTSVGTMLANGRDYLMSCPHIIFFPSLFIALLEISFNLFGNGLRDAFNPSLRGVEE